MTALELILIRHGQSEADLLGVIECNADFPLTALGLEQAQRLALSLSRLALSPAAIYASPLQRAQATATLVAEPLGLPVQLEPRLAEKNVGEMAGLPREQALCRFPLPPGGLLPHQRMGGGTGESRLDFRFRIQAAFWELRARHSGECVFIVAHGGVLDEALRFLLQAPEGVGFASGDAAFHHLIWAEKVRVLALNRPA
ncbi:MAG: histidine phosphatase family protein [Candidatus Sericytochromatia bacterium]